MTTMEGKLDKTLFKEQETQMLWSNIFMSQWFRSFVTWFKEYEKKLDILINNNEMISKQHM